MAPPSKKATTWTQSPELQARHSDRGIKTTGWGDLGSKHWKGMTPQQKKDSKPKEDRPLGSMYLFPSTDPYSSKQRQEMRAVNESVSWINRAVRIMVTAITGFGYTISVEPRKEDEQMEDEQLDKWKQQERYNLPGLKDTEELQTKEENAWTGGMSGAELEKWIMDYSVALDLQSHISRAFRYTLEQGNCGIAMLPDYRVDEEGEQDDNGEWGLPQVLRTIRPEHNVKIWLDTTTGEMSSLQTIGITNNGGKLDSERLIWLMTEMNLELNTDYYGESRILPLLDISKVMAILYGKDLPEAAMYTWHQPKIFKVEIPPRDYKKVSQVLKEFLRANNNAAGRDIAVTQNVELISGSSNTGDITGLLAMDDHMIDQIAGFFNIPPFLLSKGKAGNMGGNANAEEIDGFLNLEVRPNQEIIENFIEKQFFDRILKIIFREENLDEIPVKVKMNMIKPEISTLFNKEQYEIMLDMVSKKLISKDKMMDKLHLTEAQKDITISEGGDDNPAKNAWPRRSRRKNPHWNSREAWTGNGAHLIKTKGGTEAWGSNSPITPRLEL